jgi:iron complex outermembrane receptor protein
VLDREEFKGGRVVARYAPSERFAVTLTADYFDEEGPSFAVFSYDAAATTDRFARNADTDDDFDSFMVRFTKSFGGS